MAAPAARSQSPLVVVVDDDNAARHDLARVLGQAGFSVVQASDGAQAVALLTTLWVRVGVVISAVKMPRMSGKELARIVAERWPSVAVLLVSGHGGGAIDDSPVPFLPKPCTREALVEAVRALIRRPAAVAPD